MATVKKAARKKAYGNEASDKVGKVMHELHEGTLRSGSTGKKVTSRKQAVAIGLSEARRAGGKVPPAKKKAEATSKTRKTGNAVEGKRGTSAKKRGTAPMGRTTAAKKKG